MKSIDYYLILRPRCPLCEAPKNLLPYLGTVRRTSDWRALGFKIKTDACGHPLRGNSKTHDFSLVQESDPLIADAIHTGKKAIKHPISVFDYVLAGCELSEFVDLPDDVTAYCQGNLLRINCKPEKALPFFEKACLLNPDEFKYRGFYYYQRLASGDLSSIEDELSYFERDIYSILDDRAEVWIKALILAEDYSTAKKVISRIELALSNLAESLTTARFYPPQKPHEYANKRKQFIKKAEIFLSRIQRIEENVSKFSRVVPVEDDYYCASLLRERETKIGGKYDTLFRIWSWDGIIIWTFILVSEDLIDLNDKEIEIELKPMLFLDKSFSFTISKTESGFTFINCCDESDPYWRRGRSIIGSVPLDDNEKAQEVRPYSDQEP